MGDRRRLSARVTAARRDAVMFVRTYLQGRAPEPLVARRPRRPSPTVVARDAEVVAPAMPARREVEPSSDVHPATVSRDGETTRFEVSAGETLLAAGLRAGARMPFSCTVGGCGTCKCRVVEGEVAMEEPNCLSLEERARGFVLACVARPCGPIVVEIDG